MLLQLFVNIKGSVHKLGQIKSSHAHSLLRGLFNFKVNTCLTWPLGLFWGTCLRLSGILTYWKDNRLISVKRLRRCRCSHFNQTSQPFETHQVIHLIKIFYGITTMKWKIFYQTWVGTSKYWSTTRWRQQHLSFWGFKWSSGYICFL